MSIPTKINVTYKTVARDERGTSDKRAMEAANFIKFYMTFPPDSGIEREIGVFTLAEMRLMLGSEHPHYTYIKTYLVNPDYQADDESEEGWDDSWDKKSFTGDDGLEIAKFSQWAKKFRGAKAVTDFL